MTHTLQHSPEHLLDTSPALGITDGSDVLATIAHPDDEFLIGNLLEKLRRQNIRTHLVIASDGEASDRGDPNFLSKLGRREEIGRALAAYGIFERNQHYLGLPDSELSHADHISTMAHTVGRLLAKHTIRTVVTLGHYGYDKHPDHIATHDATAWAVAGYAAANPNVRLFGLSRQSADYAVSADPALKLRRLAHHRSQFDIDLSDPSYQPVSGTVEQPGIRLSDASRAYLQRYHANMHTEQYAQYYLT